jgi:hypothetical protein
MKNKTQGVNVFTDKVPNYGLSLSPPMQYPLHKWFGIQTLCAAKAYTSERQLVLSGIVLRWAQ